MKEEEEEKTIEKLEAVQPKKAAEKVGRKSIKNVDNVCSLLTAATRLQRCFFLCVFNFVPIQVLPPQQEAKLATVEAKVEDLPSEPTTQEEPMETEEPQEARPPAPPPEQEKQPPSPKPTTSLPPPPPLTPTIVVSEVKPTPPEVRSPKSPLSPSTPHTRVTRTRSRKDVGGTELTEQQQPQQVRGNRSGWVSGGVCEWGSV